MSFKPRWYQSESIDAAVRYFLDAVHKGHEFQILPTGSGKSVVIANIATRVKGKTLVLQPSKEILWQNYAKYCSYGYRAGIFSASAGKKELDTVTFATIGSIWKKKHLFREFNNIIIDECHLVNPEEGMYQSFIKSMKQAKVLGLTATPYRLVSDPEGSRLVFLNRSTDRIFTKLQYYVQNKVLFEEGFLAPLRYFNFNQVDRTQLKPTKKGDEFTADSVREYYAQIQMHQRTIEYANKILQKRKNLLIFTTSVSEAMKVAKGVPGAQVLSDQTSPEERDQMLKDFKAGKIRCVINVRVLDTGFDYPGLEAVLIAILTMSLSRYYQIIGRVMRIFQYPDGTWKEGWVVDLGGNINLFGTIETMEIREGRNGEFAIWNEGRQLTDVSFSRAA